MAVYLNCAVAGLATPGGDQEGSAPRHLLQALEVGPVKYFTDLSSSFERTQLLYCSSGIACFFHLIYARGDSNSTEFYYFCVQQFI